MAIIIYFYFAGIEKEWHDIESDFNKKWNFPTCYGAMNGKHCVIRKLAHTGSEYYNYKHTLASFYLRYLMQTTVSHILM